LNPVWKKSGWDQDTKDSGKLTKQIHPPNAAGAAGSSGAYKIDNYPFWGYDRGKYNSKDACFGFINERYRFSNRLIPATHNRNYRLS